MNKNNRHLCHTKECNANTDWEFEIDYSYWTKERKYKHTIRKRCTKCNKGWHTMENVRVDSKQHGQSIIEMFIERNEKLSKKQR